MTTRQYLSQIDTLNKKIQNKIIEEEQLRELATNVSSIGSGERVQASGSGDRTANIVAKMIDVQRETNDLVDQLLVKKSDVIRTIETVSSVKLYEVLFKRYVECKSLGEISDEMSYSVQYIKKLHFQALEEVQRIKNFKC